MDISPGGSICRLSDFALLASTQPASIGITSKPTSPFLALPTTSERNGAPARALVRAQSAKLPRCSRSARRRLRSRGRRRLPAELTKPRVVDIGDADIVHTGHPDEPRQHRAWRSQDPRSRSSARGARRRSLHQHPLHQRLSMVARNGRSTSSRSTPISTSSMSATASASDTATRCVAPRKKLCYGAHADRHPQCVIYGAGRATRMPGSMGSESSSVRQSPQARRGRSLGANSGRASATTSPSTSTASIRPSHPEPARLLTADSSTTRALNCSLALAKRGTIVGLDLVEVAPDYDHTGSTATPRRPAPLERDPGAFCMSELLPDRESIKPLLHPLEH